jgi:hypothetical protein
MTQEIANKLHPFDLEWIRRLPPDQQLKSALKLINGKPIKMLADSQIRVKTIQKTSNIKSIN